MEFSDGVRQDGGISVFVRNGKREVETVMIIVEVMGGLGNQMQQYALYRKLESLGKDARLDVSWFLDQERQTKVLASRKLELSWFENLPAKYCTQEEKQEILGKIIWSEN